MKAAIYRLQLFKPSETFIAGQALAFPTVSPLMVGRKLFGDPVPGLRYWVPNFRSRMEVMNFVLGGRPDLFADQLCTENLDLIHAHFSVDGLYALPLAQRLNVPLVTTLHGFDVTTRRTNFMLSGRPALLRYSSFQGRLKRAGQHFICVSEFMRDAAARAGFPENRMSVHYIGIDLSKFSDVPCGSSPRLVHVARLVEKKGTRYLIDAFSKVHRKYPDLRLDIVGDGPLRNRLEEQVRNLQLGESVKFFGVKSHREVAEILKGATAFVLPSVTASSGDAEGLGLVLLEASASGVPVIGTRHGGIPEAVVENETGFLVPERDAASLAEAIDALVADAALQKRMGLAARAFVTKRFDIRRQSAELEHIYRSIC